MARISIDGVWRQTLAETRAHFPAFATLTAAFVFLPALVFGAASPPMPTATSLAAATISTLPVWFFPAILLLVVLQSIGMLTIVAIAGDAARSTSETVGSTVKRVLPRVSRYLGALLVLFVVYLLLAIPIGLVVGLVLGGFSTAGQLPDHVTAASATVLALLVILPLLLWLGARLSPMVGVFSIEAVSPIRGIRRTWALSAGSGWRIMLLIIVFTLAVLALLLVTQGLAAALGVAATLAGTHSISGILFVVASAMVNALISILSTVALGVIYRQLRQQEAV